MLFVLQFNVYSGKYRPIDTGILYILKYRSIDTGILYILKYRPIDTGILYILFGLHGNRFCITFVTYITMILADILYIGVGRC